MGFRDYSPGLNRFLTRDMYNGALADLNLGSNPWTLSRYTFAGGNPTTLIEHDGHMAVREIDTGGGGGGGQVIDDSVGLPGDGGVLDDELIAIVAHETCTAAGYEGMSYWRCRGDMGDPLYADEASWNYPCGLLCSIVGELTGLADYFRCLGGGDMASCAWLAAAIVPFSKLGSAAKFLKGGARQVGD
jgi:hypothetical protein